MQFENDGSGGTVKPAVSRATRLGEHGGSGGTVTPAGSRATRLGEHDGSGGTVTPAGSCATRLGEHDGMTNICMYIPSLLSTWQDGVDQPWRRLHTPKQVDMHNPSKQQRC